MRTTTVCSARCSSAWSARPTTRSQTSSVPFVGSPRRRPRCCPSSPPQIWFAPCPVSTCQSSWRDRKSTRLNSSHVRISYAVFCLKKKKKTHELLFYKKKKKKKIKKKKKNKKT